MSKSSSAPSFGLRIINDWLAGKGFEPFQFQQDTWQAIVAGKSGIVNAPTGFGKTYSVFLGAVIQWINRHPTGYRTRKNNGLLLLWITPLRALAKDIRRAMEEALEALGIPWKVAVRNSDTTTGERARLRAKAPEILITTPESLHLMIASKDASKTFAGLRTVAVDEWHELMGTKRGVQVELGLAFLRSLRVADGREEGEGWAERANPTNSEVLQQQSAPTAKRSNPAALSTWGISATIGNMPEAMAVLLGNQAAESAVLIRADLRKSIELHTILPETVEVFPYAGHLGLKMIKHVVPIILQSRTTLLFTNVRSASELWYQALLDAAPELAGQIALHHSAVDAQTRQWVEEQLHAGTLKVVVCTASLDLGVDFRPVDTVIQVGSPKGVARFLQRAGRAGHAPNEVSHIHLVPTHSLEVLESVALEVSIRNQLIEDRRPVVMAYDVLIQYLVTRATGEGFSADALYDEVVTTHCYADLNRAEWDELVAFVTSGGDLLNGYDDYHRVRLGPDGLYHTANRRMAMRHRMHIGTIVGDSLMRVKFLTGGFIGTIEENFISRLNPGDAFILAGRKLALVMVKDMEALVRRSNAKNAIVPSWMGGRLPMSQSLGAVLRQTFADAVAAPDAHPLFEFMQPLLQKQARMSGIPLQGELLAEYIIYREDFHLFVYPFEGRLVHQAMAALLAYRISRHQPISFSIAMNDYGFELRADQPFEVTEPLLRQWLRPENAFPDLQASINVGELGKRKFRDIAVIAGLVFQGFPGEKKKQRHLQNSASLIYDVLREHDPNQALLRQADTEVFSYEIEAERLHHALERMAAHDILLTNPRTLTPLSFPIKVDSLREQISSEQLEDRVRRMQEQLARM